MHGLAYACLLAGAGAVLTGRRHSAEQLPLEDSSPDPWGRDWKKLADGLKFATVDTHSVASTIPMLGLPGISMENSGAGQPTVKRYKFRYFFKWLQKQDLETLVVMADTDVVYGGCDLGHLVREFLHLTRAVGKKVVSGAEFGIFPKTDNDTLKQYAALDEQLLRAHEAFGSHPDNFTQLANCPPWGSPCSDPPRYKFVNGGFYMGQVKDLKREFLAMMRMPEQDDQGDLTELHLRGASNDLIPDVTGRLCLEMYGFDCDRVFRWDHEEGKLLTPLYEHPVCFAHWNGKSRGCVRRWFPELANMPPFGKPSAP